MGKKEIAAPRHNLPPDPDPVKPEYVPHPNANIMPNDGERVDVFATCCDDEAMRRQILDSNPTRLYWPELL